MKYRLLLLSFISSICLPAQTIINAYAKVTAVTGSSVLTVSNVNQTYHTFNVGEKVIVMQMKDNVVGTNTTNVSTFGNLSAIANAGNYEVRVVSAKSPTTGTPTSITLSQALTNTYNTGTNSSVQLITFRSLGAIYTSTSNITGLAWDGNVGGVIGIDVYNIFTLNHQILADGIGFLGGSASGSADETCSNSFYRGNDANKGYKGEGIYNSTSTTYNNGRGHLLNGGGGGSQNNSGGGGGGNYTAGGDGGIGYQCTSSNSGYGMGGITLSTSISSTRVFMGGGGGGGQQNNSVGTNGANGGGIILLKANVLTTNSTCSSPIRISANGATAANSGNDGSGGGGAGGSIVLQVNSFSISSTCPLVNSASGGGGGNVTDPASHGGGGGGGQGVVIYSIAQPTANITTSVTNGTGGSDNSGGSTSSSGGGGTSGTGVVAGGSSPLPVELMNFWAETQGTRVKLNWATASEKNNAYFEIEKSKDGLTYTAIGSVTGAGTSNIYNNYDFYDASPNGGITYYRLKQVDFSKSFKYSPVVSVNFDEKISFSVFPNPAELMLPVSIVLDNSYAGKSLTLHIYDITGKELVNKVLLIGSDTKESYLNLYELGLQKGVYILKLENAYSSQIQKLIVK